MVWTIEGSRCDGTNPFKYELKDDEIILGRGAKCQLVLSSLAVSRQHCCLFKRQASWYIKDLDTKNGTSVNEKELKPNDPYLLKSGDCVKVPALHEEKTSFQFRIKKEIPQIIDSEDDESISPSELASPPQEKCPGTLGERRNSDVILLSPKPAPTVIVKVEKLVPKTKKEVDYSQDDIIIIDSDNDDMFSPAKKKETKDILETEVEAKLNEGVANDEGFNYLTNLDWADDKQETRLKETPESFPSTSGVKRTSRYDLPSSSSDDEENGPTEQKLNVQRKRKLSELSPNVEDREQESDFTTNLLKEKAKISNSGKHGVLLTNAKPLGKSRNLKQGTVLRPPTVKPTKSCSIRKQIATNFGPNMPQKGSNFTVSSNSKSTINAQGSKTKTATSTLSSASAAKIAAAKILAKKSNPAIASVKKVTEKDQMRSRPAVAKCHGKSRMEFLLEEPKREQPLDMLLPLKEMKSSTCVKESSSTLCLNADESRIRTQNGSVQVSNNDKSKSKSSNHQSSMLNQAPSSGHSGVNRTSKIMDLPKIYQEVVSKQRPVGDPRLQRVTPSADPRTARPLPVVDSKQTKRSAIQLSTDEYFKQRRNEPKIKAKDTDYNIKDVIAAKRKKHENEPVKIPQPKAQNVVNAVLPAASAGSVPIRPEASKRRPEDFIPLSTAPATILKTASADKVLYDVLQWNTLWMKQSLELTEPPPVASKLKPLKLTYDSVDDYFAHYIPLILHEIWAQVMENFETFQSNEVIMLALKQYSNNGEFMQMSAFSALSKKNVCLNDGDLVVVELHTVTFDEQGKEVFGRLNAFAYVSELSVEMLTPRTVIPANYHVPPGSSQCLRCELRMKGRCIQLVPGRMMKVRSLLYLRPTLRNVEALFSLKNSILCQDILKPRFMTCNVVCPTAVKLESSEYNESQYKAIIGSIEALSRPFSVPKLLMIQGPPGTGKTHTLIGMIKKIFCEYAKSESTPKLLVCAPSNGAIDEIAKRLHNERKFLTHYRNRSLRLVRIGQPSQVHPDVKVIHLDQLVESNIADRSNNRKKEFDDKIMAMEQRIADLDQEIANHRVLGNLDSKRKSEKEMHRAITELTALQQDRDSGGEVNKSVEAQKRLMRVDILKNADVVLTTLNSCRQSSLENIFNTDKGMTSFNCVIVDEASQCTEPEILMPLTYFSISKMILIGDPMQLPATVISKPAADCKYGRSLFERFFTYFKTENKNPVLMLDMQYRMHPKICVFPSKKFYDNKLKSCPSLAKQYFPVKPYVVFNLLDSAQNADNPKNFYNENEAEFIFKVCTSICDMVKRDFSLGIITPYQGQKRLLEQRLKTAQLRILPQINTIDGFQGQEKDVIVLSSVRATRDGTNVGFLHSEQRVNVALTRAKKCLIVCLSASTLKSNTLWKELIDDAKERNCCFDTSSTCGLEKLKRTYLKGVSEKS